MVEVINGFHLCIIGDNSPIYMPGFLLSLTIIAFFLYLRITSFRKM